MIPTEYLVFWLLPAPPALYYLYIATKAQIVGIKVVPEKQVRLAVGALALVLSYAGICLIVGDVTVSRIGLSGLINMNSRTAGILLTMLSAGLAYAARNSPLDSIARCVWAFGMSRNVAELEMSRKSAVSAKRRVRRAREKAEEKSKS